MGNRGGILQFISLDDPLQRLVIDTPFRNRCTGIFSLDRDTHGLSPKYVQRAVTVGYEARIILSSIVIVVPKRQNGIIENWVSANSINRSSSFELN